MLDYVALLEIHTILDCLKLLCHLVVLMHEQGGLPLLVLALTCLCSDSVFEPLPLLLEIFDLDLLLEEQDLLLLTQALNEDSPLGLCPVLIGIGEALMPVEYVEHLCITQLDLVLLSFVPHEL